VKVREDSGSENNVNWRRLAVKPGTGSGALDLCASEFIGDRPPVTCFWLAPARSSPMCHEFVTPPGWWNGRHWGLKICKLHSKFATAKSRYTADRQRHVRKNLRECEIVKTPSWPHLGHFYGYLKQSGHGGHFPSATSDLSHIDETLPGRTGKFLSSQALSFAASSINGCSNAEA